jgi:hypothetical protein
MADAANTVATLTGLFKVVYADKLQDLVPDFAILQKRFGFTQGDKALGSLYAQPVNLSHEAGFTYNGEAGAVADLNDAVNGVMKEAQIKGSEVILRSQLSYTALARAASQGQRAFKKASAWKVEDMNNSTRKRLEISMLYGQTGIGVVSSLSSQDIILTEQGWAGGIWAGSENSYIDVYQSDLSTLRRGGLKITAVNSETRTLTVTGTTTGIVANDVIFYKGTNSSGTFNEMAGLKKILTASTTIFNIDASTYSLWKGNTHDLNSTALTLAKLQAAVAKPVNKGLMGPLLLLVSPTTFGNMVTDQSALRSYDNSYSGGKLENGGESLVFHAVNGKIEVVAHPFVMDGDAFAIPVESLKRIGSVDLTFGVPGMDEAFFTLVPAKSAVELQCMADQAIFLEKPAHGIYFQEISNS